MHDLRPSDNVERLDPDNINIIVKPSLKTFNQIRSPILQKLLLKAYTVQLEELEKPDHDIYDAKYEKDLVKELQQKVARL